MEDLGDAGASEITDADEPRVSNLEHGPGGELATAAVLPGSVESVDSEEKAATGEDTHMDLGVPSRQIERERSPGLSAAGRAADQHSHSDASSLITPSATAPKQLDGLEAAGLIVAEGEVLRTLSAASPVGRMILEESGMPAEEANGFLKNERLLDGSKGDGHLVRGGDSNYGTSPASPHARDRKTPEGPRLHRPSYSLEYVHVADDWRKDRDHIDMLLIKNRRWAAYFGLLGSITAIGQHELVVQGYEARSALMNILKAAGTFFTVLTIVCIYRVYRLSLLFNRVKKHLNTLVPLDVHVPWAEPFKDSGFWQEFFVCVWHVPPFVTAEIGFKNFDNFILYRIETASAIWSWLRLYLFGRVVRDSVLSFRSMFFICFIWMSLLFLAAYWYRAAESTACQYGTPADPLCDEQNAIEWNLGFQGTEFEKANDSYLWNSAWLAWSTTTTAGYGDITPTTHLGRLVACVIAMVGIGSTALLTAAFANVLRWTPREMSAMSLLEREAAKRTVKLHAAEMIKAFTKRRREERAVRNVSSEIENNPDQRMKLMKSHMQASFKMAYAQIGGKAMSGFERRMLFQKAKQTSRLDADACSADTVKLEQAVVRAKFINLAMIYMEAKASRLTLSNEAQQFFVNLRPPNMSDEEKANFEAERSTKDTAGVEAERIAQEAKQVNRFTDQGRSLMRSNTRAELTKLKEARNKMSTGIKGARITNTEGVLDRGPGGDIEEFHENRFSNAVQQLVLDHKHPELKWRRNRTAVYAARMLRRQIAAGCALIGGFSAVAQNELLLRGTGPNEFIMLLLKLINSIASITTICVLVSAYWHDELWERLDRHITRGLRLDVFVPYTPIFESPRFIAEAILCIIHVPPGITWEFSTISIENIVVYRIETMGALFNLLRFYLVWWVFTDWMLHDLPNRHTVAHFAKVKFDSLFAIKRALNSWHAVWYIMVFWGLLIIFFGYLYRSFEITSCLLPGTTHVDCDLDEAKYWYTPNGVRFEKSNDVYIWNSCWFIFITMTTVGYGDFYPYTHVSRLVSIMACFCGIVIVSIATGALSNIMRFTGQEDSALIVIEREKARLQIRDAATLILQTWWRRKHGTATKQQAHPDHLYKLKADFKILKGKASVDVEDCMSDSAKIEKICDLVRQIGQQVDSVARHLYFNKDEGKHRYFTSCEPSVVSDGTLGSARDQLRSPGRAISRGPSSRGIYERPKGTTPTGTFRPRAVEPDLSGTISNRSPVNALQPPVPSPLARSPSRQLSRASSGRSVIGR